MVWCLFRHVLLGLGRFGVIRALFSIPLWCFCACLAQSHFAFRFSGLAGTLAVNALALGSFAWLCGLLVRAVGLDWFPWPPVCLLCFAFCMAKSVLGLGSLGLTGTLWFRLWALPSCSWAGPFYLSHFGLGGPGVGWLPISPFRLNFAGIFSGILGLLGGRGALHLCGSRV